MPNFARAHHGQRRLNRFLHHFAQGTGVGQLAFARHAGGFDGQQIAAHFRPRQPGDFAHAVFGIRTAVIDALHAQVILQVVAVDLEMLELLVHQQRFHRFTAQLGDFTLQLRTPASRV